MYKYEEETSVLYATGKKGRIVLNQKKKKNSPELLPRLLYSFFFCILEDHSFCENF